MLQVFESLYHEDPIIVEEHVLPAEEVLYFIVFLSIICHGDYLQYSSNRPTLTTDLFQETNQTTEPQTRKKTVNEAAAGPSTRNRSKRSAAAVSTEDAGPSKKSKRKYTKKKKN